MMRPGAHIAIAAALSAVIGAGGAHVATRMTLPTPTRITHVHQGPLKHAWPDLSAAQQQALAAALPDLKGVTVEIFCNDAACGDLSHDLDDVFQDAGANSSVERSAWSMGSGLGVSPDDERGRAVAAAIKQVSGGALDPKTMPMDMAAACALPMTFEKFEEAIADPANPGTGTSLGKWRRVPDTAKFTDAHRACLGRIVIAIAKPPR